MWGQQKNLFNSLSLYNKGGKTYTIIYPKKSKYEMSQVLALALRKLWNFGNRSYIPMKMVFLCQYRPSNSPPTSQGLPSVFMEPLYFYNKCSHLLQQKVPESNHCPTQDNNQLPTFTKTTTDKIMNSQYDGCFLKVA